RNAAAMINQPFRVPIESEILRPDVRHNFTIRRIPMRRESLEEPGIYQEGGRADATTADVPPATLTGDPTNPESIRNWQLYGPGMSPQAIAAAAPTVPAAAADPNAPAPITTATFQPISDASFQNPYQSGPGATATPLFNRALAIPGVQTAL